MAVTDLSLFYEQLIGKLVTHSSKRPDLSYAAEPQTEASIFVSRCFHLFDKADQEEDIELPNPETIKIPHHGRTWKEGRWMMNNNEFTARMSELEDMDRSGLRVPSR